MSDQSDGLKLDLALSVSDQAQAQEALNKLIDMKESKLWQVLRPHWEDPQGITDQSDIALRRGFGLALNRLAALELGFSTGYLSLDSASEKIEPPVRDLLKSRAVAKFIDDYDYFQIRFLAARIELKEFKLPGLPEIPALVDSPKWDEAVGGFLNHTLKLQNDPDVQRLYSFLDDYTYE